MSERVTQANGNAGLGKKRQNKQTLSEWVTQSKARWLQIWKNNTFVCHNGQLKHTKYRYERNTFMC